MNKPSAYADLMGSGWDDLPPGVRVSHEIPLHAEGVMHVRRPQKGIAKFLTRFILLPPSGEAVPVRLDVEQTVEGARWTRRFGNFKAVSEQRLLPDRFVETAGPFTFEIKVWVEGDRIKHEGVRCRLFGLPLPKFLAPRIHGTISDGGNNRSWCIDMMIEHRLLGLLCAYKGMMKKI